MASTRRNHYDVTNRVNVSHPGRVCAAIVELLQKFSPQADASAITRAIERYTALYAGTLPGYHGCDTWYHDVQHSLDCALAMTRLLDGHERSVKQTDRLGPDRVTLGIIIAIFHDAGYVRSDHDQASNGAAYTLTHVRRSGEFIADFLPEVGMGQYADLARHVVHFTGYEIALDKIDVQHPKDRLLGFMLGTADILAQTSDRCYLEKCRDFLFREFTYCGMAGTSEPGEKPRQYPTSDDLLSGTPDFNRHLWKDRLDGYFQGVHRYMNAHFGGSNPYVEQIEKHLSLAAKLGKKRAFHKLNKRPQPVDAKALREMMGLSGGHARQATRNQAGGRTLRRTLSPA
ncbi:MAG: hypothetical protein ACPGZP_05690 [Panacagrimonas sp.]